MSKILIVEDEEAIADLEKDYLELSGFEDVYKRQVEFTFIAEPIIRQPIKKIIVQNKYIPQ